MPECLRLSRSVTREECHTLVCQSPTSACLAPCIEQCAYGQEQILSTGIGTWRMLGRIATPDARPARRDAMRPARKGSTFAFQDECSEKTAPVGRNRWRWSDVHGEPTSVAAPAPEDARAKATPTLIIAEGRPAVVDAVPPVPPVQPSPTEDRTRQRAAKAASARASARPQWLRETLAYVLRRYPAKLQGIRFMRLLAEQHGFVGEQQDFERALLLAGLDTCIWRGIKRVVLDDRARGIANSTTPAPAQPRPATM